MYCRVFACDFDGTGATDGHLAPELAAALGTARAHGFVTLLVTGRVHEEVESLCEDLSMFDGVVAENGAVVCLPGIGRTIHLGEPPPADFLGRLRSRGIPFQAGSVVVGTWERHAREMLELVREFAIDGQLIFNRGALMLLPSGVNKATGVRQALDELRRAEHNMIAFGDAENDLPLFKMAALAVAARGSRPQIAAQADEHLSKPGGAGVARYLLQVVEANGVLPTPRRHQIPLGIALDGSRVTLPGTGLNVMVTGDPRSGKSWLAGLIAEQLIDHGYRLCVIDPEGDYASLGQRPRVLQLGHELPLPDPVVIPRVLRDEPVSIVISLTALSQREQSTYVHAALRELADCADRTGIPQWIVVDEAQYFFHDGQVGADLVRPSTNFVFATYRPSLVSDEVFAAVKAHLVTHTAVEEERYFISGLLRERGPRDLLPSDALATLSAGRAGLLIEDDVHAQWVAFTPGRRLTAHAHHARKYVDTWLPETKAFRFLHTPNGGAVAHNVIEFYTAVQKVPVASLRHHLANGDFSRWVAEVLGDEMLARGLRKLEYAAGTGAAPERAEILAHVADQYLISPAED